MLRACDPGPSLWGAAEASTADRDEDFSGTKPLHRLPVALRVAGDALTSVDRSRSDDRWPSFFAVELAKTVRPSLRVTPSVAPLRRASNCGAAEEEALGASARRGAVFPVVGAGSAALTLDCDLTGATLEGDGLLDTAGLVLGAARVTVRVGAGLAAGAGLATLTGFAARVGLAASWEAAAGLDSATGATCSPSGVP